MCVLSSASAGGTASTAGVVTDQELVSEVEASYLAVRLHTAFCVWSVSFDGSDQVPDKPQLYISLAKIPLPTSRSMR